MVLPQEKNERPPSGESGEKSARDAETASEPAQDSPTHPLPSPPRVLQSDEILQGDTEVQIVHLDKVYRLRRTRNGKLILQK